MPKGAKKRKAAKKKHDRKPNLDISGSNSLPGNDELRSQDEKESDAGEVSSPASQGENNPFVQGEGEEEEKRDPPPVRSIVSEEKITEETIIDAEDTQKAGLEEAGIVQIDWEIKSEDETEVRGINVEDKKFQNGAHNGGSSHDGGSSSSRSSSNSGSDDEAPVVENNFPVVEAEKPNEEVSDLVAVAETQVSDHVVAELEEPTKEEVADLVMEELSDIVLAEEPKEVSSLLEELKEQTEGAFDLVVVEWEEPKEDVSNLVVEPEEPNEEVSESDLEVTPLVLPSDEVVEPTYEDNVSKQISISEEVIHVIPTVLVENTVTPRLVEFESKENSEKISSSPDEGTEVTSHVTSDLEAEKKEDEVFPLVDEKEDKILPSSGPNIEVLSVRSDSESEKKVAEVARVDETSNGAADTTVSKVPESSENQMVVASTPRLEKRTAPWWGCCGLFDLVTSSDR